MQRGLITTLVTVISILVTGGLVYAASTLNITSTLGGKSGDSFDLDGTMIVDSLKVGAQGVGGVTFFNGTIINNTTTSGADNPVTFGDNVRIDGTVYRGATAGTADTMPFKINDNLEVAGSLTIGSLSGTGIITTGHILDGTIATSDIADSAITTAKITDGTIASGDLADSSITSAKISDGTIATADLASGAATQGVEGTLASSTNTTKSGADYDTLTSLSITTGVSSLFCTWSGYGDTINDYELIRVQMLLDGVLVPRTIRLTRTSSGVTSGTSIETHAIFTVAAGVHTVALQWNTETSANIYYNTLDCIELKK